jgi:hypothetical protein
MIVSLSRPGFSKEGDMAIVDVTYFSNASCCSNGEVALLKHEGRAWRLVAIGGWWWD